MAVPKAVPAAYQQKMDGLTARGVRLRARNRPVGGRPQRAPSDAGFTILELVISMALLAIVAAPLASVFWSAIRTAGSAAHRTDGSSIASREIEGMRAVPYAQVGFYADQPGYVATWVDGGTSYDTVDLGPTSPATGTLVPQMQPSTPDPSAASGFAPDPNPANAVPIVQGGVTYTVARYVVWSDAHDASSTFDRAYKRLTVIVDWTDQAGAHVVRQDSLLYPGGLGVYAGPMGGASTTSTTILSVLTSPSLSPIVAMASPADETQVQLSWSQPGGGAVSSYSIEYSTDPTFPAGNFAVIAALAPSIVNYTVTNLTPDTTYYFEIVAYNGANSAVSASQSAKTAPLPGPVCTFGGLNVAGATSLSTTGTILQTNGKMSENLTLSWSTTGPCADAFEVKAADPTSAADPGSPYPLVGSSGAYSAVVPAAGSKSWAVGLHTFTVFDVNTSSTTSVVKTFKVCVHGVSSC